MADRRDVPSIVKLQSTCKTAIHPLLSLTVLADYAGAAASYGRIGGRRAWRGNYASYVSSCVSSAAASVG